MATERFPLNHDVPAWEADAVLPRCRTVKRLGCHNVLRTKVALCLKT
jgi:hypothetical protein